MFTDSQDKEKPSIPEKSTQMQEANAEERAIMKQQDALHEKMKGLDKNSKEYKDLMDKSRDLDNQLPAFD
jgi:tetrahydromethanopterin S-methyltransferase subunit B